jgi:hypothetical protein
MASSELIRDSNAGSAYRGRDWTATYSVDAGDFAITANGRGSTSIRSVTASIGTGSSADAVCAGAKASLATDVGVSGRSAGVGLIGGLELKVFSRQSMSSIFRRKG